MDIKTLFRSCEITPNPADDLHLVAEVLAGNAMAQNDCIVAIARALHEIPGFDTKKLVDQLAERRAHAVGVARALTDHHHDAMTEIMARIAQGR